MQTRGKTTIFDIFVFCPLPLVFAILCRHVGILKRTIFVFFSRSAPYIADSMQTRGKTSFYKFRFLHSAPYIGNSMQTRGNYT